MQWWEEGSSRDKSCFFDLGFWMFKRKAFQPTPQWLRNSSFYSGGLSAEMWKPSEKNIPPPLRISTRRDPEDLQTRTESYFQDGLPQRASVGKNLREYTAAVLSKWEWTATWVVMWELEVSPRHDSDTHTRFSWSCRSLKMWVSQSKKTEDTYGTKPFRRRPCL